MYKTGLTPRVKMIEGGYVPQHPSKEALICMTCSPEAVCKDRCKRYITLKAILNNKEIRRDMTILEKIKILLDLRKIGEKIAGVSLNSSLDLAKIEADLINKFEISLEQTTPKSLFGRPYSQLTSEELAMYTQIKRALKRF